jgi:hypothetical protein
MSPNTCRHSEREPHASPAHHHGQASRALQKRRRQHDSDYSPTVLPLPRHGPCFTGRRMPSVRRHRGSTALRRQPDRKRLARAAPRDDSPRPSNPAATQRGADDENCEDVGRTIGVLYLLQMAVAPLVNFGLLAPALTAPRLPGKCGGEHDAGESCRAPVACDRRLCARHCDNGGAGVSTLQRRDGALVLSRSP